MTTAQSLRVSILTTTPGELPHTLYGHTAIRIIDEENDFDRIYNFGLVDFNAPGFMLDFLKGNLDYWVGRQTIPNFIELNNREGRLIEEQVLNVDQATALKIYQELKFLHHEDNKYYRYSFTKKNCTTQIRDVLVSCGVLKKAIPLAISKRRKIENYTHHLPWFRFGINLIMGKEVDYVPSERKPIFLPKDLQDELNNEEGLVMAKNNLNDIEPPLRNSSIKWYDPLLIFTFLLVLTLVFKQKWIKTTIYLVVGGMGSFLLYLMLVTQHTELMANFNVLWCNPIFLLLPFIVKRIKFKKIVVIALLAATMLALLIWIFAIQVFDFAVLPFIFILLVLLKRELHGMGFQLFSPLSTR